MFKSRYVIIAAAGLLLLGWLAFRHSSNPAPVEAAGLGTQTEAVGPTNRHARAIASEAAATAPVSPARPPTNLLARVLDGEGLPVTLEQLAPYLEKNRRDAGSLLAAFQATRDRALL